MNHILFVTGDPHLPSQIVDRNGEVIIDCCKVCGDFEEGLKQPCELPEGSPWISPKERLPRAHETVLVTTASGKTLKASILEDKVWTIVGEDSWDFLREEVAYWTHIPLF